MTINKQGGVISYASTRSCLPMRFALARPCCYAINTGSRPIDVALNTRDVAAFMPLEFGSMRFLYCEWHLLSDRGPSVAYAASAFHRGCLYVHGGVDSARSTHPLNKLYRFSPSDNCWTAIDSTGSPSLSHHCCVVTEQRYLLFIGGWNGRGRTSDLFVFDCEDEVWIEVHSQGFPQGAGLSSHTANLMANGEVLIVGREGSLRTQRRSGNAFILSGSVAKGCFTYRDHAMGVSSRSGHTATCIGANMAVIGGRDDKILELHRIPSKSTEVETNSSLFSLLSTKLSEIPVLTKPPGGRKGHSSANCYNFIIVYGGETFDGRSKEPVDDIFLVDSKASYAWRYVGHSGLRRAGHCCTLSSDSGLIIHGGVGEGNKVTNSTYVLNICS